MVTDGLAVLCRADAGGLDEGMLAELLLVLEQADAMTAAARASILGAFTANLGYESDGHGGLVAWLMDRAQATRGRARAQVALGKKLRAHPQVAAAMAAGGLMGSWAGKIMEWTGRLPVGSREQADEILLGAAAGGARSLPDQGIQGVPQQSRPVIGRHDDRAQRPLADHAGEPRRTRGAGHRGAGTGPHLTERHRANLPEPPAFCLLGDRADGHAVGGYGGARPRPRPRMMKPRRSAACCAGYIPGEGWDP